MRYATWRAPGPPAAGTHAPGPQSPSAPSEAPAVDTTPPVDIETLSGAGQQSGTDAVSEGYVTPLAHKLAADEGVDLSAVRGTGFGGRIRKQDVRRTAQKQREQRERAAAEPAAPLHTEPEPAGTPEPVTGPAEAAADPAGDTESPEDGRHAATTGRSSPGPAESASASRRPGTDDPGASSRTGKRAWVVAGAMSFVVALVAAGAVWLSSPSTLEPVTTLTSHDEVMVQSVAFAPGGDLLATGGIDGNARVWDVGSGEEVTTIDHDGYVWPVAFTEDGDTLTTTSGISDDTTTRVWDVESGQEISSIDHGDEVGAVDLGPGGDFLATTGADGTFRVWDVESGEEVATVDHGDEVGPVAFAPDGGTLATGGEDNGDATVQLWDVP